MRRSLFSNASMRSVSSVMPRPFPRMPDGSTSWSTGGSNQPVNGAGPTTSGTHTILRVRPRPARLKRLPQQYFVTLLGRVAAAAAEDGPPLIDLGRGNPETGPPPHVVEALRTSALDPTVHGYSPIRGLPRTKEAIAGRYRDVYGVELDPETEVALIPGTKTGIVELALSLCDEGETLLLPVPDYRDYPSGPALAGAEIGI